ncbi:MAG TPA: serine hydrolase domain-containing protein [Limnochordia bacterium]|mgnify:CR=1 FL=1|nr:serine hydrolase domain-containing protein [Limnochordia bacterium]
MKKICAPVVFLILLMVLAGPASAQSIGIQDPAALEAFFDGVFSVQLAHNKVPGAEIVVVSEDGILFAKGYGFADLEERIPMIPGTTLYRPGSVSKILVWLAVMQLVEQGRLDLYVDVNTYLDFTLPQRTTANRDVPPITLHHLLTHSAGFEDEVMGIMVSRPELLKPLGQYVRDHLPARVFVPGSVMAYSNYGTALAAYIVELVSGQPFAQYVQENILEPLGMTSTTFAQELPPSLAQRVSKGYRYAQGRFIPGEFEYVQNYPAGGLTTSGFDLARLMLALLNFGELPPTGEEGEAAADQEAASARLLAEETARTMQSRQFSAHPQLPGMTYGLMEWEYNGYRILGHVGDTFLFSTGFYFLPEEKVGLIVAYNSPAGSELRSELLKGFMDRYFPSADTERTEPRPITPGTEANYRGYYFSSRANYTGVESLLRLVQTLRVDVDSEGYLLLQGGGEVARFGEIAPGLFQALDHDAKIAFSFQEGKAVRILLPGPAAWLRVLWFHSPRFLLGLLGGAVLFMLLTLIGWIKGLFRTRPRHKPLFWPKALAVLFILLLFTTAVVGVELLTTVHPAFNVPLVVLEPSSTLKALLILSKILMGLSSLILVTAIYLLAARKGTLGQRIHYAFFTLSVLGVTVVLWQLNLW